MTSRPLLWRCGRGPKSHAGRQAPSMEVWEGTYRNPMLEVGWTCLTSVCPWRYSKGPKSSEVGWTCLMSRSLHGGTRGDVHKSHVGRQAPSMEVVREGTYINPMLDVKLPPWRYGRRRTAIPCWTSGSLHGGSTGGDVQQSHVGRQAPSMEVVRQETYINPMLDVKLPPWRYGRGRTEIPCWLRAAIALPSIHDVMLGSRL